MLCKKCNSEIPDGSKFCLNCGNPINEETATPIAVKPKKRIVALVVAVSLVISGGIGSYVYKQNYDKKVMLKKQAEEHFQYQANFLDATISILTETIVSEKLANSISSTWQNAISKNKNFNTEVSDLLKSRGNDIEYMKFNKGKIEEKLQNLQNPPDDYKDAHTLLVELYSIYGQLHSYAINPTGNLTTYTANLNTKLSEFNRVYDKLAVLRPEIKQKK